jgi:hypothetical protein
MSSTEFTAFETKSTILKLFLERIKAYTRYCVAGSAFITSNTPTNAVLKLFEAKRTQAELQ